MAVRGKNLRDNSSTLLYEAWWWYRIEKTPTVDERFKHRDYIVTMIEYDADTQSSLCICLVLCSQMADRFVECTDHSVIHDVAIFVGSREKLTPNWKEDISYMIRDSPNPYPKAAFKLTDRWRRRSGVPAPACNLWAWC